MDFNYFEHKKRATARIYTWRPHSLAKNRYWPRVYWALFLLLCSVGVYCIYELFRVGYYPIQLLLFPLPFLLVYLFHLLTCKVVLEQEEEMLKVSYYVFGRLKQRRSYLRDDIKGFYHAERHLIIRNDKGGFEPVLKLLNSNLELDFNAVSLAKLITSLNKNWQISIEEITLGEGFLPKKRLKPDPVYSYVLKKHDVLEDEQSFYIGTVESWKEIGLAIALLVMTTVLLVLALFHPITTKPPTVIECIIMYLVAGGVSSFSFS